MELTVVELDILRTKTPAAFKVGVEESESGDVGEEETDGSALWAMLVLHTASNKRCNKVVTGRNKVVCSNNLIQSLL